jgi:hypothetical protein
MTELFVDSDDPKNEAKLQVLIGRTITAVHLPQDINQRDWKMLVLILDDGSRMVVNGQSYETACVDIRIGKS